MFNNVYNTEESLGNKQIGVTKFNNFHWWI